MKPKDRLELARTVIGDIVKAWDAYERTIKELAEPSMSGGGGGRPSGISDPTLNAVIAGQPYTQHKRETEALITELVGNAKGIERHMWKITAAASKPSPQEKKTMQCSGEHDPLCEEPAAVPSKRGMCANGYMAWYRAQQVKA